MGLFDFTNQGFQQTRNRFQNAFGPDAVWNVQNSWDRAPGEPAPSGSIGAMIPGRGDRWGRYQWGPQGPVRAFNASSGRPIQHNPFAPGESAFPLPPGTAPISQVGTSLSGMPILNRARLPGEPRPRQNFGGQDRLGMLAAAPPGSSYAEALRMFSPQYGGTPMNDPTYSANVAAWEAARAVNPDLTRPVFGDPRIIGWNWNKPIYGGPRRTYTPPPQPTKQKGRTR